MGVHFTPFSYTQRTVGVIIMSLDLYTQNIPLTQKARFWSNYVSALKGSQDLRAPEECRVRTWHPSILETLPSDFPDLKHEFGKLDSLMLVTGSSLPDMLTFPCILRSTELTEHRLHVCHKPQIDPFHPSYTSWSKYHHATGGWTISLPHHGTKTGLPLYRHSTNKTCATRRCNKF